MKIWNSVLIIVCLLVSQFPLHAEVTVLTLDECVNIALEKNPALLQSQFYYDMSKKDIIQSMSSFLPTVSTGIGYNHSVRGPSSQLYIDPTTGIPVPVQPEITSWSSGAGFDVQQNVLNLPDIYGYKRSLSLKNVAKYDLEDMRQSIILLVSERYYYLLKAEKLLEVQDSTLVSSEESFKNAEMRYQIGSAPKSDMLKARVQLETDRLSHIQAQNDLSIARASLNHVLGFDVDYDIKAVDDLSLPEIDIEYKDAIQNGLQFHPALLKGKANTDAAKDGIGVAASVFLPSISAYYSYSWRHEKFDQIKDMFDKDYNWNAGIRLSLPIFQGFSRVAELSKTKLHYKWYQEATAQMERDVSLEVKQSYFEVDLAKKAILVAGNQKEAAEEDLRLNKEKYRLGAGTMLDLINAHVSYAEAQSNQIQTLYDYKFSVSKLKRAMGQLNQ